MEASVADVAKNARLVVRAARDRGADFPLVSTCLRLYEDALRRGRGGLDMAAVVDAVRGPR